MQNDEREAALLRLALWDVTEPSLACVPKSSWRMATRANLDNLASRRLRLRLSTRDIESTEARARYCASRAHSELTRRRRGRRADRVESH